MLIVIKFKIFWSIMFQYNRFWHFWFQLNNQHYFRASLASLVVSLLLVPAAVFFPPLWALVVAVPLIVSGTIALCTQLSNFFYNQQNQRLTHIKTKAADEALNEEIDLYLNRRVVCPDELLVGAHLNLPHDTPKMKKSAANAPLIFKTEDTLDITNTSRSNYYRNPAIKATSQSNQLYVKTASARNALSEVAAREMAEILGFRGLIPSNTIARMEVLYDHENRLSTPNAGLVLSRQKISALIEERKKTSQDIKNSLGVQNAVAKFIFNLKTAAYRTKAQKEEQLKLLHVQKLMPNVIDGLQIYLQLFNEPVVLPGQPVPNGLTVSQKRDQRAQAEKIIRKINLHSFQENFLLHLILGSQDANPGNTLFTDGSNNDVVLHSIDHELIMPEDNYNITKRIPLGNGKNPVNIVEKDIKNVFPIRLWLAGLPQADAPFTKEMIEKTLNSLNPERLLAYHRQKKLFSPAAVGAQLERILLIKKAFEEEIKKSKITLTPKELFLKLINNHPTYIFLKNELKLSNFHVFVLLGQIPEGADMSLLRHPLQWFPMLKKLLEATQNEQQGRPSFSSESFQSPHAHHLQFFSLANISKMTDTTNQAGLKFLTETSDRLRLH